MADDVTATPGDTKAEARSRNIYTLRGSVAWRDWLHRLAEHSRSNVATVIDQAVAKHARDLGFDEPPPRR